MKIRKILASIISVFVVLNICFVNISAGISYSGSTSVNLYVGGSTSVKITLSNAAGRVNIKSSNTNIASVNASSQFLDNSSMTVTIRGVKEGKTTVTISGTYSDYSNPKDVNFSRTITINVYAKTSTNVPSNTPAPSKSSVKLLGSLSAEGYKFEEDFSNNRTEYTLYAPFGTENINIKATAASSKATLSKIDGTVKEGWNTIEFTCTAEDGSKQTYKVKVYVEEKPEIYLEEGSLGVVKNIDRVKIPEGFEKETIEIDEKEVVSYKNKGIHLLYLADEEMNKDFYIYDKETKKIISKYNPIIIDNKKYIKLNFDYEEFAELEENYNHSYTYINDERFEGWVSKASNLGEFKIIYLLNEDGNRMLYTYDIREKTLQRFVNPVYQIVEEEKTFFEQYKEAISLSIGATGILALILSMVMTAKANKKVKKNSK